MSEREPVLSKRPRKHLTAIFWRWSQTRGLLEQTLRHLRLDVADCGFFISLGIALFLFQVEPVLWRKPSLPGGPVPSPLADPGLYLFPFEGVTAGQTSLLWIVLAVAVGNAWLLNHIMRTFGGNDASFRGWLLVLRPALAATPFLGLCTIPLWRALIVGQPVWAIRHTKPKLCLDSPHLGRNDAIGAGGRAFWSPLNQLGSSMWFAAVWTVPVNLMALRAGLAWLSSADRQTAGMLHLLEIGRLGLRCLGLLFLGLYLARRKSGQQLTWGRKILLTMILLAWLIPQLPPFLVTLLTYWLLEGRRTETAIQGAFSRTGAQPPSLSAGPNDAELPAPARWLLGSTARREAGSAVLIKKLGFYRMKTFLLILDTGMFVLVGQQLAGRFSWLAPPIDYALALLAGLLVLVLAVSLVARSWAFVEHFFRPVTWQRDQDRHPSMRYASLSSLAFIGGLFIGVPAAQQDTTSLARELAAYCTQILSPMALFLLPGIFRKLSGRSEEDSVGAILWLLVFQLLGQLGAEMGKSPEMAQGLTLLAHRAVLLTPIWALLLWGFRGSWVLRPFRMRDIFNPQLPLGFRWRIGLIALSSAMPMGGLAIPLWIRSLRKMESGPLWSSRSGESGPESGRHQLQQEKTSSSRAELPRSGITGL